MRKSMIATALVAAAGLATTASANQWSIAGASYNPGSQTVGSGSFTLTAGANDLSANTAGTGSQSIAALNGADVTALNAAASWQADSINYFSYVDGSGRGYFGIAISTTVSRNLTLTFGASASNGSKGVLTNAAITGESFAGGGFVDANQTVASGVTYYIFGGFTNNVGFTGSISPGTGETGNFGIAYWSWNGSGFSNTQNVANGATSSSLSVATYSTIPVPAPALLAGAGLVGAAALRRRMAKKA